VFIKHKVMSRFHSQLHETCSDRGT